MRRAIALAVLAAAVACDRPATPGPRPSASAQSTAPAAVAHVAPDARPAPRGEPPTGRAVVPALTLRHVIFLRFVRDDVSPEGFPMALSGPPPFGLGTPSHPMFGSRPGTRGPDMGGPGADALQLALSVTRPRGAEGGGGSSGSGGADPGGFESEWNQHRWTDEQVRLDIHTVNLDSPAASTAMLWYAPSLRYETAGVHAAVDYRTLGVNPALRDLLHQQADQIRRSLRDLENGALAPAQIPTAAGYGAPPMDTYRQGLEDTLRMIDDVLLTNDLAAASQLYHMQDWGEGSAHAEGHRAAYETYTAAVRVALGHGDRTFLQHVARRIRGGASRAELTGLLSAWDDAMGAAECLRPRGAGGGLLTDPVAQDPADERPRVAGVPRMMWRHVVWVRFRPDDVEAARGMGILPSQRRARGLPEDVPDVEDLERMRPEDARRAIGRCAEPETVRLTIPPGAAPHVPSSVPKRDAGRVVTYLWTRFWFQQTVSHIVNVDYFDSVRYSGDIHIALATPNPFGHGLIPIASGEFTNRRMGISPAMRRALQDRLNQIDRQLDDIAAGRDRLWGEDSPWGPTPSDLGAPEQYAEMLSHEKDVIKGLLGSQDPFLYQAERNAARYADVLAQPGLPEEVRPIVQEAYDEETRNAEIYRRDVLPFLEGIPPENPGPTPADFLLQQMARGVEPARLLDTVDAIDAIRTSDLRADDRTRRWRESLRPYVGGDPSWYIDLLGGGE